MTFAEAYLGAEVEIGTIHGPVRAKIPSGTQSGQRFRLRGKGLPDVGGRGKGDLFVTLQAVTPKKLNKEQRQLFEQLAKALPAEKFEPRTREDQQEERNLFDRVKDMFG